MLSSSEMFALLEELIDIVASERLSEIDTNTRQYIWELIDVSSLINNVALTITDREIDGLQC